jgi:hypothetical protein
MATRDLLGKQPEVQIAQRFEMSGELPFANLRLSPAGVNEHANRDRFHVDIDAAAARI